MIKRIIKILLVIFLIIGSIIYYFSVFGITTDKFNNQIIKNILKFNKKINLNLTDVNYLLNPYNFTINIKTTNPQIFINGRNLEIKNIQTNVGLKSIINGQFSINDLQIITKEIKVNNVIALLRIFKDSTKFFVLNKLIIDGFITAKINLNFDEKGNIKEDFKIIGSVKKVKLNILNQVKVQNFNFNFNINKKTYLLRQVDMKLNNVKINFPLIEIVKKKNLFFVNGEFLSDNNNFDIKELKLILAKLHNVIDIQKIEFSSKNNFSFRISESFKIENFKIESIIDLNQLIINQKNSKLKSFLPGLTEELKFEEHKIFINYVKDKFNIKGNGKILLDNKSDSLSYQIIKDNIKFYFDTKIKLKKNSLLIDFLEYEKKEGLNSLVSIKGNFKKNNQLRFDSIILKEENNEISIKGLELNKSFKIVNIENFNINYKNNRNIINKINLKKNNSNFIIEGESFDASRIINNIMNSDEESQTIFDNLNSKINIRIDKTYIDETNYINNLYGNINFDNNKINDLNLESTFPNAKKLNLSIKSNKNSEIITKLFSAYPKPLIKRYDFIKGFEEGYLDFYSSKKEGVSNSVLIIDNFKVKEVPIFAKILSLASLQGIADLLTGEGIRFTDFEMNFSSRKDNTIIEEMYAIGPAVSILMDGYIEHKKLVSLRGTLVPATTINRSIASIPLIGKILIGDKIGEGVFGVSFKIKGSPKDLKTTVNPIKSLTPRFITRTLEKIKKN